LDVVFQDNYFYKIQNTNVLIFVRVLFPMDNGLITSDGTKVLTVAEYDRFINFIPIKFRPIFEINTITGLRYVELQRLYDHEEWYYTENDLLLLESKKSFI